MEDERIRRIILDLTGSRPEAPSLTDERFDRILEEFQKDREENRALWKEQNRRWDENTALWKEQSKKWEENDKHFQAVHEEIMALNTRIDHSVSALGARWGMKSESSFRNGLRAILEDSFSVEVINYNDFDEEGKVFGKPEQVELDIIIKNGVLIICEIKSSMSRADMHAFMRKADYYEEKHTKKADRRIVISPMIDDRARETAQSLQIECYTHSYDAGKNL